MPVQTEASSPECLTFKPLGINTWQEHVIYMHPDSAICRAEGFTAQVRADRLAAQLAQATVAASAREGQLIGRWVRVSDDLVALVARLEGAKRRRAVETDAVRQAFREEPARMAGRIKGLEQDLAVARPALEVYRRRAVGGTSAARRSGPEGSIRAQAGPIQPSRTAPLRWRRMTSRAGCG